MRWLLPAALLAPPAALLGWVLWCGAQPAPGSLPQAVGAGAVSRPEARGGPAALATAPGRFAPDSGAASVEGTSAEASAAGGTTPEDAGPLPAAGDAEGALRELFAAPFEALSVRGTPSAYDEKSLFEAINGAAPVFLERGFRRLLSVELVTGDRGELTCDVFDMRDAGGARAIFEQERSSQAKARPDWAQALVGPLSFVFHEGRYYVKLTAFDPKAEAALPGLARALRGRIR